MNITKRTSKTDIIIKLKKFIKFTFSLLLCKLDLDIDQHFLNHLIFRNLFNGNS
jgi:hypothetical protein